MLKRIFSRNKNSTESPDTAARPSASVTFDPNEVRLLFCQNSTLTGKSVVFDSRRLVPADARPGARRQLRGGGNHQMLGELMFGTAPLRVEGVSTKVHKVPSHKLIMLSKVFCLHVIPPSAQHQAQQAGLASGLSQISIGTDGVPQSGLQHMHFNPQSNRHSAPVPISRPQSASVAQSLPSTLKSPGHSKRHSIATRTPPASPLKPRGAASQPSSPLNNDHQAGRPPTAPSIAEPVRPMRYTFGVGVVFPQRAELLAEFVVTYLPLIEFRLFRVLQVFELALARILGESLDEQVHHRQQQQQPGHQRSPSGRRGSHNSPNRKKPRPGDPAMIAQALQTLDSLVNAVVTFQNEVYSMFAYPRLQRPLWIDANRSPDVTVKESVSSVFFVELVNLLPVWDTSKKHFLISTLVTAFLTNNLSWVASVSPDDDLSLEHRANDDSSNPIPSVLGNHLEDVYGISHGFPRQLSRTVVFGKERSAVSRLLGLLSYFLRVRDIHVQQLQMDSAPVVRLSPTREGDTGSVDLDTADDVSIGAVSTDTAASGATARTGASVSLSHAGDRRQSVNEMRPHLFSDPGDSGVPSGDAAKSVGDERGAASHSTVGEAPSTPPRPSGESTPTFGHLSPSPSPIPSPGLSSISTPAHGVPPPLDNETASPAGGTSANATGTVATAPAVARVLFPNDDDSGESTSEARASQDPAATDEQGTVGTPSSTQRDHHRRTDSPSAISVPLPRCHFNELEDSQAVSHSSNRSQFNYVNLGRSLIADYCPSYTGDFVLMGAPALHHDTVTSIFNDLELYVAHCVPGVSRLGSACVVVADIATCQVEVFSCRPVEDAQQQSQHRRRRRSTAASTQPPSPHDGETRLSHIPTDNHTPTSGGDAASGQSGVTTTITHSGTASGVDTVAAVGDGNDARPSSTLSRLPDLASLREANTTTSSRAPVNYSQLVHDLLHEARAMWIAGLGPGLCSQYVEDKLREICSHSRLLACYLSTMKSEHKHAKAIGYDHITTAIGVSRGDIPLLLATASVFAPSVQRQPVT